MNKSRYSIYAPIIIRIVDVIEKEFLAGQLLAGTSRCSCPRSCTSFSRAHFEWRAAVETLDIPDISRKMICSYLLGIATDKYREGSSKLFNTEYL